MPKANDILSPVAAPGSRAPLDHREVQVMEIIWRRVEVTARDVPYTTDDSRAEPASHGPGAVFQLRAGVQYPMTRQAKASNPCKNQQPSAGKNTKAANARLPFEHAYPTIAQWIEAHGWIELGHDDYGRSMVRAFEIGGMVWEGNIKYPSLDELLRD